MEAMKIIGLLKRYWKPLAVVLFLLLYALYWDHHGAAGERSKWELLYAKDTAASAIARQKATEAAMAQEHKWAVAFDAAGLVYQEQIKDDQDRANRIIAGLRSGRLRFEACAAGVSQVAADSVPITGRSEGGQPGMVGEEITARLAACDAVTRERNMAVELLRAERR